MIARCICADINIDRCQFRTVARKIAEGWTRCNFSTCDRICSRQVCFVGARTVIFEWSATMFASLGCVSRRAPEVHAERFSAAHVDCKTLQKHGELLLRLRVLQNNVSFCQFVTESVLREIATSNSTFWRFSQENIADWFARVAWRTPVSCACFSLERRAGLASRCGGRALFVERTDKAPSTSVLPDNSTARKRVPRDRRIFRSGQLDEPCWGKGCDGAATDSVLGLRRCSTWRATAWAGAGRASGRGDRR